MKDDTNKLRIDKWLWAARFYKTRSLAADAVESGKVLVNEVRAKPAKAIAAGDRLDIRIGQYQFLLEVLALSSKRGPAPEAQNSTAKAMPAESDALLLRHNSNPSSHYFLSGADRPNVTDV